MIFLLLELEFKHTQIKNCQTLLKCLTIGNTKIMKKQTILLLAIVLNTIMLQAQSSFDVVISKGDSLYERGEFMKAIKFYDNAAKLKTTTVQKQIIDDRKDSTYASVDRMMQAVKNTKNAVVKMKTNMEIAIFDNAASSNKKKNLLGRLALRRY